MWRAGPGEVFTGQAQKALYLLKENPLLFDSCIESLLEEITQQREQENEQTMEMQDSTADAGKDTLALRKRMEEVREHDRLRIVKELLYIKVLAKFKTLGVPLIRPLKGGGNVKFGMLDLKALTADVYSADALALVREHLFRIIGQEGDAAFMGGLAVVQIALFQVGQVYAMSALFGYYLRRADSRYQLEKLAGGFGEQASSLESATRDLFSQDAGDVKSLKDYISNFGPEEVQRVSSIASVEAQMAMELQVTALYGDLRILKEKLVEALGMSRSPEEATRKLEQAIQNEEVESLRIKSDDLRRLVLEAVAFGALLNDSERQVDMHYELTPVSATRAPGTFSGSDDEDGGRFLNK